MYNEFQMHISYTSKFKKKNVPTHALTAVYNIITR